MRVIIPVPEFRSIEEAKFFAARHTPLRNALKDFQNRDVYSRYGEPAKIAAMKCWECASRGDMEGLARNTRALSKALPTWVFDYEKRY